MDGRGGEGRGRGGGEGRGRGGGEGRGRGGGEGRGRGGGEGRGRGGGEGRGRGGGEGRGRGGGEGRGRGGSEGRGRGGGGGRGRGGGGGGGRGRGGVDHGPQDYRYQPRDAGSGQPDRTRVPVNPIPSPPAPAIKEPIAYSPGQPGVDRARKQNVDQVSASPADTETEVKVVPVRRPDNGGILSVRNVKLLVNHFPLRFDPGNRIYHYDVDVKPDVPPKNGRPVQLSKHILSLIREKLCIDNPVEFPLAMTAYDGEKNIFSAVPLPVGKFSVKLFDGDGEKERSYTYTIMLVNELKFSKWKDYLAGNVLAIPREILQGMDLVMKENPARNMVSFGRSFYPADSRPEDYLERGVAAYRGFQHSLKPTKQGVALALDYSVLAFRMRMPVLDFLKEHIPGFTISNFGRYRLVAEKALKGLKVTVTHRKTKQKYTIGRFTDNTTRHLSFEAEEEEQKSTSQVTLAGLAKKKKVTLVDHFMKKYGKEIMYKDIPCLDVGKSDKNNWVPMEFCVLVEGQRYPMENLDDNARKILKRKSSVSPQERQNQILEMVHSSNGPCGGDFGKNFGIQVNVNMTKVTGRVLGPPKLKLISPNGKPFKLEVDKNKCHWNLVGRQVPEGKPIKTWAVLDFSSSDHYFRLNPDKFIPNLIGRCRSLGIPMEEPLFYQNADMVMFSNSGSLLDILEWTRQQGHLQFLLCVMSKKHTGYKYLKWLSETKVGIVTQCCLSSNANRANDQYYTNLALKINAKLGGSNVELFDRFGIFEGSRVMFIGADVNHPASGNTTSPSIAAVVGTLNWPAANRYAARVRPQTPREEQILNFGEMCLELTDTYARINGSRPEKIVIFRDGVSESQFEMALNKELQDVKKGFQTKSYYPTITLIVAQKRHQTRLFPESDKDGGGNGNVAPGTVVDTTIVHPFDFNFYLCSHFGGLGTSKPTHYYVLWNEHGFDSDQLEQLIYNLCFTFARCTKPVSLVTPVYYADLAAYRGRLYHDAVTEDQAPSSRASSSSSSGSFEERFYKLHGHLENGMFFI